MTLELSEGAALALKKIGDFGPTVRVEDRRVKGYSAWDGEDRDKVYVGADELREVARGLIEAADYLDARASAESSPNG